MNKLPGVNLTKIKEIVGKPLVAAGLGVILGVIIGLVIGWGIWPVEWVNASPMHLREEVKVDYLRMAVESYGKNKNEQYARQRWSELGDSAPAVLKALQADSKVNAKDLSAYSKLVNEPITQNVPIKPKTPEPGVGKPTEVSGKEPTKATQVAPVAGTTSQPTKNPFQETPKQDGLNPMVLFGVFCGLTLLVFGVLVYLLFLRKRLGKREQTSNAVNNKAVYPPSEYNGEGQEAPIAQFMTTYMLGDDLYDDSFSIDSPTGEFLGECGVGISDTIGVGDPKKISAFEVWLFDKNDIQTVTKVLMSSHAYNDPNIRQRLISKGEPIEILPGKQILLETATLQLEARVVDMNYGQGALPENSFFERMTLELAIWTKSNG